VPSAQPHTSSPHFLRDGATLKAAARISGSWDSSPGRRGPEPSAAEPAHMLPGSPGFLGRWHIRSPRLPDPREAACTEPPRILGGNQGTGPDCTQSSTAQFWHTLQRWRPARCWHSTTQLGWSAQCAPGRRVGVGKRGAFQEGRQWNRPGSRPATRADSSPLARPVVRQWAWVVGDQTQVRTAPSSRLQFPAADRPRGGSAPTCQVGWSSARERPTPPLPVTHQQGAP